MAEQPEPTWWETTRERLHFYNVIITAVLIDAFFLVIQFLINGGLKWCVNRLETPDAHGISPHHLLISVFDWVTFSIVIIFLINDLVTSGKRIWGR